MGRLLDPAFLVCSRLRRRQRRLLAALSAAALLLLGAAALWRGSRTLQQPPAAAAAPPPADAARTPNEPFDVPFRAVAVAKVGNESPYVLEWIEYHRLQGFDKFALYVDDSPFDAHLPHIATLRLLPAYYTQLGFPDLVDVFSISALNFDHVADVVGGRYRAKSTHQHRLNQQTLVKHAWATYKNHAEWIAHFDVDEFFAVLDGRTLAEFLDSLYTVNLDDVPLPDRHFVEEYRVGYLTGVYIPSVSFTLGDATWFAPMVELEVNPVSGRIELLYTPTIPAGDLSLTPEERLGELVDYLNEYGTEKDTIQSFQEAWRNTTRPLPAEFEGYPFQLERQRYRAPTDQLDEPLELLRMKAEVWPEECGPIIDAVNKDPERWEEASKSLYKVDKLIREGGYPVMCRMYQLPNPLTSMGKTMLWTGRRHRPPPGFKHAGDVAMERAAVYSVPTKALNRTVPLRRGVPEEASYDVSERPLMCHVPWVHGCAHHTELPIHMMRSVMVEHHFVRALEDRTVGDKLWTGKGNAWGKFQRDGKYTFDVLKYVHFKEAPNALVESLKIAFYELHRPIRAALRMDFEADAKGLRMKKVLDRTQCPDGALLAADVRRMCPESHPFVGVGSMVNDEFQLPYTYCLASVEVAKTQRKHPAASVYTQDLVACPGCTYCDYSTLRV